MSRQRFIASLTGGAISHDGFLLSVSRKHGISAASILSPGGNSKVSAARYELFSKLRGIGLSYPKIARMTGFHHTTVMYGLRKHEERTQ